MVRLRATGADWGLPTDEYSENQVLNILCYTFLILILSLPHYHRHITIYVVHIINTMLGRMCLLLDLHFTLLYVVVSISTYI